MIANCDYIATVSSTKVPAEKVLTGDPVIVEGKGILTKLVEKLTKFAENVAEFVKSFDERQKTINEKIAEVK